MGTTGKKSIRGQGEHYAEVKDQRVNLLLTLTARRLLDQRVLEYSCLVGQTISRNEYVERWLRGLL
jgi:hypothetical protein